MAFGTNLPIEQIEQLAAEVQRQSGDVVSQLSALRSACQRDPNFTGNAADRYDEYMRQWDVHQKALADNLEGAGQLLRRFADAVRATNDSVNFDI